MITLKNIGIKYPIDIGAPSPTIVCTDDSLTVIFYVDLFNFSKVTDTINERNRSSDTGVAILKFKQFRLYKFGTPNDEAIIGHPYYKLGLKSYSFFLVDDSDWIKDIKRIESHHPYFKESDHDGLKHYIITFKDNTFECIAKDYSIDFSFKPLYEVLKNSVSTLD